MKNGSKGVSLIVLIFVLAIASMIIVGIFRKHPVGTPQNEIDAAIEGKEKASGVVEQLQIDQQIKQNAINQ